MSGDMDWDVEQTADRATEWLLCAMVVFAPWAFGTTETWSIWIMTGLCYLLGMLLAVKWASRRACSEERSAKSVERGGERPRRAPRELGETERADGSSIVGSRHAEGGGQNSLFHEARDHEAWTMGDGPRTMDHGRRTSDLGSRSSLPIRLLALLTVLILVYILIHALNARATYLYGFNRFEYYDGAIPWLPHTYDRPSTWFVFWQYLGLACFFWAFRDWLLRGKYERERTPRIAYSRSPTSTAPSWTTDHGPRTTDFTMVRPRLRRLIWLIAVNAALLSVVGIFQRLSGVGELLWLVEPRINKDPLSFFGPYAYRATASLYFNMVWPVALGLWWIYHRAFRQRNPFAHVLDGSHHVLLVLALFVAASPVITTSRGGSFIVLGLAVGVTAVFRLRKRRPWTVQLGILGLAAAILGLGGYFGWEDLSSRLEKTSWESFDRAVPQSHQIAGDYPVFGTGPGTFDEMYNLYTPNERWEAYTHNDWLETRITFGWVGTGMIVLAFGCVLAEWLRNSRRARAIPTFDLLVGLAIGGCLFHSFFDFPFQIYSTLFYFLLLCGIMITRR